MCVCECGHVWLESRGVSEADGPALTFKGKCVTRMPAEVLFVWISA